jgi:hypothetical protein
VAALAAVAVAGSVRLFRWVDGATEATPRRAGWRADERPAGPMLGAERLLFPNRPNVCLGGPLPPPLAGPARRGGETPPRGRRRAFNWRFWAPIWSWRRRQREMLA